MKKFILFTFLSTIFSFSLIAQTTLEIGGQRWSGENLNVKVFNNGDKIPQAKTKEEWVNASKNGQPAWCYLNNDPANGEKYGILYNWYAVTDPRGIAPEGWRLPTKEDVEELMKNIGTNGASKIKSTDGWAGAKPHNNTSGFNGKPGGMRNFNAVFQNEKYTGVWWTATKLSPDYLNSSYNFHVRDTSEDVGCEGTARGCGMYVRLIMK
jgi:uncharacterized protein (TIGR02145 family)